MGLKCEKLCPFCRGRRGELGSNETQCRLGRHLPQYQAAPSCMLLLATIEMGRKLGAPPPFLVGGAGSQSNTKSPGVRPTSITIGILIHPAISLQQIWAENWGRLYPLSGTGELSPYLTKCGQGRGLPACQVSSWSVQPFGHSAHTLQTDR